MMSLAYSFPELVKQNVLVQRIVFCEHFFAVFRLKQLRGKVTNIVLLICSYYYNFFLVAISGDSLYLFFVNYFAILLCTITTATTPVQVTSKCS